MPGKRFTSQNLHQLVLILIFIGLILGIVLPVRASEDEAPWSLRDTVRSLEPCVVWIMAELELEMYSQGSGFIVHEDGYIITNAHVVEGATAILVGWPSQFERSDRPAEIIAIDLGLDLALLKIDGGHLPFIPVSTTDTACLGDAVITLGYPIAEELGLGGLTVTRGILSCIRETEEGDPLLLQTDAAVTLGCSGGPLYDLDTGTVIGIIQGKGMALLEGFNFAVPSDVIYEFSQTDPEDGLDNAIVELDRAGTSHVRTSSMRILDYFDRALSAREELEWNDALTNFLAASLLDGEDPEVAFGVAESYAGLEQPEQALEWLERAFELGYTDFDGALDSDGFTEYSEDDRFVDLVETF